MKSENKRKGLIAVLIIGCLMTLIGTAMSSALELGIVNGFGIFLAILSRKGLRAQENHEFIRTNNPSEQWAPMKKKAGITFCISGIILAITATAIIGTAINIATAIGTLIFLLGAGKSKKPRALSHHTNSVVWLMRIADFPSTLIVKAQNMKRQVAT